ncbi:hypothetical protein BGW80DRAFT_1447915 [Lactifluus volemus]|nr:hypothetical protein BGW80DRAFT_1447915 [Lactifluus volemus]
MYVLGSTKTRHSPDHARTTFFANSLTPLIRVIAARSLALFPNAPMYPYHHTSVSKLNGQNLDSPKFPNWYLWIHKSRQEHLRKVVFVRRKFTRRHAGYSIKCRTTMNGTRSTTSTCRPSDPSVSETESVPPQTAGVPANANNKRLRTGGLGGVDTSSVACPGHHTTVTIVTASSVLRPIKFEGDCGTASALWKDNGQPIFVVDVFVVVVVLQFDARARRRRMGKVNMSLRTGDAFDRMAPYTQKSKLSIELEINMVISASASSNGDPSHLGPVDSI